MPTWTNLLLILCLLFFRLWFFSLVKLEINNIKKIQWPNVGAAHRCAEMCGVLWLQLVLFRLRTRPFTSFPFGHIAPSATSTGLTGKLLWVVGGGWCEVGLSRDCELTCWTHRHASAGDKTWCLTSIKRPLIWHCFACFWTIELQTFDSPGNHFYKRITQMCSGQKRRKNKYLSNYIVLGGNFSFKL